MPRTPKIYREFDLHVENEIRDGEAIHGYGHCVLVYEDLKPAKFQCAGCSDDYYNQPGNSSVGECWMFANAVVVDKIGHSSIHVAGGPDTKMKETLDCWHSIRK